MHDFGAIRVGGGDAVETRSKEEIPSTLDEYGCVDGTPSTLEELHHCGQRFAICAEAHKRCVTEFTTVQRGHPGDGGADP
jgi:hypothetical protein